MKRREETMKKKVRELEDEIPLLISEHIVKFYAKKIKKRKEEKAHTRS